MSSQIDQRLNGQVQELEKQSKRIADLVIQGTATDQDVWFMGDKGAWNGDLFAIKEMGDAFSRKELNDKFAKTVDRTSDASTGQKLAQRLTGDVLMAKERAFRLRHASEVRCFLFAAGRMDGQGNGVLTKLIIANIQDLDKAGQAG